MSTNLIQDKVLPYACVLERATSGVEQVAYREGISAGSEGKGDSNGSDQVKELSIEPENDRQAKNRLEAELTKEQMRVAEFEKRERNLDSKHRFVTRSEPCKNRHPGLMCRAEVPTRRVQANHMY